MIDRHARRIVQIAALGVLAAASLLLTRTGLPGASRVDAARGEAIFAKRFSPDDGLGPLFNDTSCLGCHATPAPGGVGPNGLGIALRVGRLTTAGFDPLVGQGGPVARARSIAEFLPACRLVPGIPAGANVTSVRNAPALFGLGEIVTIPDAVILAGAGPRGDGIAGRPNMIDQQVGRFGWKADVPRLDEFVAAALHNELGLTSPLLPDDITPPPGCGAARSTPDVDPDVVESLTAYVASLPPVASHPGDRMVFDRVGCRACHVPSLGGVPLYSDLLLHDMGRGLDDAVIQGQARGQDWRTAPLWGLSQRTRFLHDGRATSVEAAILAHAGEAEAVVGRFRALPVAEREALVEFLRAL